MPGHQNGILKINENEYFKNCVKPNNSESIRHFEQMPGTLRTSIEISKQKYYFKLSRKLAVNKINPKCYWSILKSFLSNKKIPCIPPLIHNNQFVVDFKEKSELFNSFFAKQCTYIETGSNLPTHILRRTNESLNTINFTEDDILNVIRKLDPSKAHGHDQISIRMVQICDKAICKPLHLIFPSCIESEIFPTECKMGSVGPIHKQDDKENVKNHQPVSLLPIFGKYLNVSYTIKCNHFL